MQLLKRQIKLVGLVGRSKGKLESGTLRRVCDGSTACGKPDVTKLTNIQKIQA